MKNKFLIILFLSFFICGCGNYRELNNMAIVTGISIDKNNSNYELSVLIANSPKAQTSSKEGEAQTTVYSASGNTIAEAVQNIGYKSPKKLYFGHINIIVISEEVGKSGFLNIADYFFRTFEARKKFFIIQTRDDKAKDILKIISPLESFPSQSIATLLKSNQETQSIIKDSDYSTFISKILAKGYDPTLPVINVSGKVSEGKTSKNIESTEPKAFLKLNSIAIYRGDKFQGYVTLKDGEIISLINGGSELQTCFKYQNSYVCFKSEDVRTKFSINNSNSATLNIEGNGDITEINGKENLQKLKVIKNLENKLNDSVKNNVLKTINKMKYQYHADVFGFGNKIYKKYPLKWQGTNWNEKHFPNLNINIKTKLSINSAGALDKTIKEVKS